MCRKGVFAVSSELFCRILQIAGSRTVLLLVPITDTIVIGLIAFEEVGRFSVAALVVQVFVVLAGGMFVGNYVRQDEHCGKSITASTMVALVGGLASAAVIALLAFLLKIDVQSVLLLAAPGIVPVFLFACCASILESSGEGKLVFQLTVGAVIVNIALDFIMVRFISDPADAVMLAATVSRVGLGAVALISIANSIDMHHLPSIRDEVRAILKLGLSEALTRALFVMGMAFSMSYAAYKLSKVEMSIVGAVLNGMNVLFVIGMAIILASAVELRAGLDARVMGWFLRFGKLAVVFLFLAGSAVSWSVISLLWPEMMDVLVPVVLFAVTVVCLDFVGNHILMALRAMGHARFPPFARLAMFPILLFFLGMAPEPESFDVFLGMAVGNGCASLAILILLIRYQRDASLMV